MSNNSAISFHPKLAAGLDLFLGGIFLWWLTWVSIWWLLLIWLGFRLVLWAVLIKFSYHPSAISRWRHFFGLVIFCVGALCYLVFMDWQSAWLACAVVFVLFPAISFGLLPPNDSELYFTIKPYRRWNFSLALVGLAGCLSGLFAVPVFQLLYQIGDWVLLIVGMIISTVMAWWWWIEYGIKFNESLRRWLIIWPLISLEAGWVIYVTPLGYLTQGLILTWIWYILWLLARFHLSDGGLNWVKQKWFLISNVTLFLVSVIFLIRWK